VDALGRVPRNAGSQAGGARCGAAKRRCEALQSILGAAAAGAALGVTGAGGGSRGASRASAFGTAAAARRDAERIGVKENVPRGGAPRESGSRAVAVTVAPALDAAR